jgi:hypothetical protein
MFLQIRNRVMAYVATHKTEVRFFCFLLALALVVNSASNIEDLINAFLGSSGPAMGA